MSRKKKPKPAQQTTKPPASADAAAVAAPRPGHLKESIEHFKELLKRERRPEWLEGLAQAYAGRAEQLAAKGMINEALALWRTRAEACQVPLLDGPYLGWLLQAGQTGQALALLPQLARLPDAARERARGLLAPALLAAPDQLLAGLAEEDRRQTSAARAAIAACTSGDNAALDVALQAISFRSPYRDLRPLLKAMVLLGADRAAAVAALARVPAIGPFEPMAAALRVCLLPRNRWLAGMQGLDDGGRALVLELEGCPPAQRALVLELAKRAVEPAPSAAELLDLLLRHRRELPPGFVRRSALSLLPHAAQRLDAVNAAGLSLTQAERDRVLALAAELKQRPDMAEVHWLRLVDGLAKAPDGSRKAALVLRHLADAHAGHAAEGALCRQAHAWLTRSLQLDPSDRATPLRLARAARADGDLKQARKLLDAARERFPTDTPLLMEAVEVALAAGSFKKAAGLAKQVLQFDPINPQVRSLIGRAHLSHARKQIRSSSLVAARLELDEAANWLRGGTERGLLTLLRGLAAEPPAAGDALLREAVVELGGPLIGALHLLLEVQRVKRLMKAAPAELLRRAGIDLKETPAAAEVLAFARALHEVAPDGAALREVFGVIGAMLERAAGKVEFSESDHLLVCEALHRHHLDALTRRFAAAALRRWPKRPVFIYLEAAARFGSAPWTMSEHEWERLDLVHEQALDQGDQRTATRLGRLLSDAEGRAPWPGGRDDDDDFDDNFEDEDGEPDLQRMINLFGGEDQFLAMTRQHLGAATYDRLLRESKGNKARLLQTLIELLATELHAGPAGRPRPPAGKTARKTARKAAAEPRRGAPGQKDLFDE